MRGRFVHSLRHAIEALGLLLARAQVMLCGVQWIDHVLQQFRTDGPFGEPFDSAGPTFAPSAAGTGNFLTMTRSI
jgi:hypothetical protein